jgi:very-short-patch-repair endonuclease
MARFQTNVAGTSYYSVDFSSIKKSSRVEIVLEPNCPYDKDALRVIIDGKHVGYLKKGFNRTIANEIKTGSKVTARVRAVVGGGAGKNHGIVLNLVVDDGQTRARSEGDNGQTAKSSSLELKIIRSSLPHISNVNLEEAWINFYNYKKKLPPLADLPNEPNYEEDFDRDVPWLTRLWSESFDSYCVRRRQEWLKVCAVPKSQNENRLRLIKQLNGNRKALDSEFQTYFDQIKLENLLQAIRATIVTHTFLSGSPFVTVYERTIWRMLKPRIPSTYHQAEIDGNRVDILCIPNDLSQAWVIEVDGGIHRREAVIKRDRAVERKLKQRGVSLIRIPNYMVTKSPEACILKILETMDVEAGSKSVPAATH